MGTRELREVQDHLAQMALCGGLRAKLGLSASTEGQAYQNGRDTGSTCDEDDRSWDC